MLRPRVKGGVVKVKGVSARVLVWWVCIYNTARRQFNLSVILVRNFQALQALQALQPLQPLQALQALQALQPLQPLQAPH